MLLLCTATLSLCLLLKLNDDDDDDNLKHKIFFSGDMDGSSISYKSTLATLHG